MGLALVERTIASVGGSIRLVPIDPGSRGTTFEVVWPKLTEPDAVIVGELIAIPDI